MGGAAWTVSQHTKNPKLAVALITFVTEDNESMDRDDQLPSLQANSDIVATGGFKQPTLCQRSFPCVPGGCE